MAKPQKIIISQQYDRSETPMANRMQVKEIDEGPFLNNFSVSIRELFVVLKNWALAKFFVLESNRSVDVKGFNRPRASGSLKTEGHMKDSIGIAKYQRDPRNRK